MLTTRQIVIWSILTTIGLEVLTCILRFGMGFQSTAHTASTVGVLTGGIRIHHSYIGVLVVIAAFASWKRWAEVSRCMLVAGNGLIFSDLIHHFLVLWPIVGSPCFDLVYPA